MATETVENMTKEENQIETNEAVDVSQNNPDSEPQTIEVEVITPTGIAVNIGPINIVENFIHIKQTLNEYFETCLYTNIKFELHQNGTSIILNDFTDIASSLPKNNGEKLTLRMILEDYDMKSSKLHVKRVRELLQFPPQMKATANELSKDTTEQREKISVPVAKVLPHENVIFGTETQNLESYYNQVLYQVSSSEKFESSENLTSIVRSISFSGWNSPPSYRKIQGDLYYLEVHTSTDTIFVTATAAGFYVNQCTKTVFNPSPASSPHFSHELMNTLFLACPSLKKAWNDVLKAIESSNSNVDYQNCSPNALDSICKLFRNGNGDMVSKSSQWISANVKTSITHSKSGDSVVKTHSYDSSRAQDELNETLGMEEKGSPREWNEEIQIIRNLAVKDINESIMKNRYINRIITEFTDSCKLIVIAISQGQLNSINPMDSEETQVYVFNNIFISRTVDTKETFKISEGNEACRKYAGHDLHNQKIIQAADVPDLHTVLTTIVDYKGYRYVGQSIIPGILQTDENNARLMYGTLQDSSKLKIKQGAWVAMKCLAEKLQLAERKINCVPSVDPKSPPVATQSVVGGLGLLSSPEIQQQTIRVDDEDEEFPADSTVISHIGPIEGKILKGSDGRMYAFEMNRLTPRDANYVKANLGGTGNIDDSTLDKLDPNILMVYTIRPEMIQFFKQNTIATKRQEAMLKILFEQQKLNEQTETVSATEETRKNSENEDQQVESNTVSSSEKSPLLTPEIIEAMRNVQDEPFEFSLNPNVFLPSIKYGVEAEVAESDENTARSIASMLWNQVLPHITEQIRTGEVVPQEGRALTDYLHQRGVNMRYLGRLAELARKQEDEDVAMLNGGHQRRQPMPYYWLELLEIEIAARVMKHILNREITASKSTHAAPAFTIAKLLNHLFGSDEMTVEQSLQFINDAKSKKSIKKAGVQSPTSSVPESQASSISKNNFWKLFGEIAISKFGHSNSLLFSIASDTFVASRKFHQRISPMSLLRRLCQLSGVRISAVHYDFSHSTPFTTENIVDIVPVAKSCEPDFPLLEARQMVDAAKVQLQHLNIAAAFELCQDASRWIQQVTGPVHKESSLILEMLSQLLIQAGDNNAAISTLTKSLAISVQLYGLDSMETFSTHLNLAAVLQQLGNHSAALSHYLAAKYIIWLIGGPHHPEFANMYFRIATIFADLEHHDVALRCYLEAKKLINICGDQAMHAFICQSIGDTYALLRNFKESIAAYKQSYLINRQLFGETDSRTVESKSKCELVIRTSAEQSEIAAKERLDRENEEKARKTSMWLDDDTVGKSSGKKGSNAKNKKGKKK